MHAPYKLKVLSAKDLCNAKYFWYSSEMSKAKSKPDATKRESCVVCGKVESLRRGLCNSHYQLFTRERTKVLAKGGSALDFEAKLVEQGLLAPDARSSGNPYFDFWFADAITAANLIESSDNESIRFLAESLIAQEDAILRSKMEFLSEMKRRGIRPNRT